MGGNEAVSEKPVHRVSLDAYYMDKYEVTVGQYAKFLEATSHEAPPEWKILNQPPHQKFPVVTMDWSDANMYCHWAEKRLPTEAEWEKAARGTDGQIYPWGNGLSTPLRANIGKKKWDKHAALVPVSTLEDGKSPYGIYDMGGNAWEWVSD
jgi:formylglycine-generating enzyme required for sulfatase activity